MNDYISREAAEERLNRLERESYHNSVLWPDHVEECREAIRDIPPADVRPVKRGEWMMMVSSIFNGERFVEWSCSECWHVRKRGWRHTDDGEAPDAKFCENCGAKMGGADNG